MTTTRDSTGCPEKTDTIICCYNSQNKHSTFKNGTCLNSQKHGKTEDRCYMACTTPVKSWQLLKTNTRCKPPSGGLAPAAARSAGDWRFCRLSRREDGRLRLWWWSWEILLLVASPCKLYPWNSPRENVQRTQVRGVRRAPFEAGEPAGEAIL